MRRARAYSSFGSQVILVYLDLFRRNSLFAAENCKNWYFFGRGIQSHLRSSKLVPLKITSSVLVMISSMCVPICSRFHARQTNSGKIITFMGYPCLTPACPGLLKHTRSGLGLLKYTFNSDKIRMQVVVYQSPAISAQFTLELCVAVQNREKFIKTLYFGGLASVKIINVNIPQKFIASACYDRHHVCAYLQTFYARRATSGKITSFRRMPQFRPLVRGDLLTQRHEIWSRSTKDSRLSYGENPKSFFYLTLAPIVTGT